MPNSLALVYSWLLSANSQSAQFGGFTPDSMTTFSSLSLWQSFELALATLMVLLPWTLMALLVLVVGFFVARGAGKFVAMMAKKLGLQTFVEREGLAKSMRQAGIRRTAPQVLGSVVFWLVMYCFAIVALNMLWPESVAGATRNLMAFIPKALLAVFLLLMGLLLATFVKGLVETSARALGSTLARPLATGVYWLLLVLTALAAFEQLEIPIRPLERVLLIACAAVAVAFAISVGLGGREVVAGLLAGFYVRQRLQPGDSVEVAGFHGTIREVGPVATTIETEEGGLMRRHSIPNSRMLSEAVR